MHLFEAKGHWMMYRHRFYLIGKNLISSLLNVFFIGMTFRVLKQTNSRIEESLALNAS